MLASLLAHLGPIGPLHRTALAGAFASWWHASRPDLSSLIHSGYAGLVDGWLLEVRGGLERVPDPTTGKARRPSAAERRTVYEHPVVRALMPGFADDLRAADAAVAAAEDPDEEMGDKDRKAALKAARARLSQLEADVFPTADVLPGGSRLERERWAVRSLGGERDFVLGVLCDRLMGELEQQLQRRRGQLHDRYRKWEEKYALSLAAVEAASEAARSRMWDVMRDMGYAN
jgi:type I restriction enzyme M protein